MAVQKPTSPIGWRVCVSVSHPSHKTKGVVVGGVEGRVCTRIPSILKVRLGDGEAELHGEYGVVGV